MQHAPSRHEFTSVEHVFTNNTWSGILYRCWKLIVVFNPWKYFQFLKGGVHTAGQYSHPTKYVAVFDPLHWPTKQQNQRRQTRLITWAVISTLSPHAKLPVTSLLLLRKMKMSLHRGNINLNLFDHHSTNLTFAKRWLYGRAVLFGKLRSLHFENTVVNYRSVLSKWEFFIKMSAACLLSSSFITWGRMRARKAALILMKNNHFDRTPQYVLLSK